MTSANVNRIINERLCQSGEQQFDDFEYGTFIDKPNTKGMFQIKGKWFVYETDEKNIKSITGPFSDDDIVYVCAKMLHKSKFFEDYRFSSDAKKTFIHVHYRSIREAEESL